MARRGEARARRDAGARSRGRGIPARKLRPRVGVHAPVRLDASPRLPICYDFRPFMTTAAASARLCDSVLELIGNTPMLRLTRFTPDLDVRAKLEFFNPAGS